MTTTAPTRIVRPGIYLEDNPPARDQFRIGRRDPIKPVQVAHSTETGRALARAVARSIRDRPDAGSYGLLGDETTIYQMVDFANESYSDRTGSNRWAIHWSLCMDAAEWGNWNATNPPDRLDWLLWTAAHMATISTRWLVANGHPPTEARLLVGKAASNHPDANGITAHGWRDPTRRSDPGPDFPWPEFFARYQQLLNGDPITMPTQPDYRPQVEAVQTKLVELGLATLDFGSGPIEPADYIDGRFGDTTKNDVIRALTRPVTDPDIVAAARNYIDARNKADAARHATDAALMDESDAVTRLEEALDR